MARQSQCTDAKKTRRIVERFNRANSLGECFVSSRGAFACAASRASISDADDSSYVRLGGALLEKYISFSKAAIVRDLDRN